jgi:hypothetical protein
MLPSCLTLAGAIMLNFSTATDRAATAAVDIVTLIRDVTRRLGQDDCCGLANPLVSPALTIAACQLSSVRSHPGSAQNSELSGMIETMMSALARMEAAWPQLARVVKEIIDQQFQNDEEEESGEEEEDDFR